MINVGLVEVRQSAMIQGREWVTIAKNTEDFCVRLTVNGNELISLPAPDIQNLVLLLEGMAKEIRETENFLGAITKTA